MIRAVSGLVVGMLTTLKYLFRKKVTIEANKVTVVPVGSGETQSSEADRSAGGSGHK